MCLVFEKSEKGKLAVILDVKFRPSLLSCFDSWRPSQAFVQTEFPVIVHPNRLTCACLCVCVCVCVCVWTEQNKFFPFAVAKFLFVCVFEFLVKNAGSFRSKCVNWKTFSLGYKNYLYSKSFALILTLIVTSHASAARKRVCMCATELVAVTIVRAALDTIKRGKCFLFCQWNLLIRIFSFFFDPLFDFRSLHTSPSFVFLWFQFPHWNVDCFPWKQKPVGHYFIELNWILISFSVWKNCVLRFSQLIKHFLFLFLVQFENWLFFLFSLASSCHHYLNSSGWPWQPSLAHSPSVWRDMLLKSVWLYANSLV